MVVVFVCIVPVGPLVKLPSIFAAKEPVPTVMIPSFRSEYDAALVSFNVIVGELPRGIVVP